MGVYANDIRFVRESDSDTIQAAIDYASACGEHRVVIPRLTADGRDVWSIDKCILLPSEMTVILRDCHLRMADGVRENMFRNKNAWTPLGNTLEGEQHNIRLIGEGQALLDGGEPNGLCEQLHRDHPDQYPSMYVNLTVFFHNVRHFEVRNIQFTECRYWAVCFMFCRWGRVADLDMRMRGNLENQDGVDLRIGCEYITVENITGLTGDDTVALTALPGGKSNEGKLMVQGKSIDIHDVTIRNIISATHGCALLRLLNAQGARLYNIVADTLIDTGEALSGSSVLVGTTDPMLLRKNGHVMGDFENVVIKNVFSKAQKGISFAEPCRHLTVENVVAQSECAIGLRFCHNFVADNVTVRNVVYSAASEHADCVLCYDGNTPEHLAGLTVEHLRAVPAKYHFRGAVIPMRDAEMAPPTEGEFTSDKPTLPSAYGRYHRFFYGKPITNRPTENRIDGTLK